MLKKEVVVEKGAVERLVGVLSIALLATAILGVAYWSTYQTLPLQPSLATNEITVSAYMWDFYPHEVKAKAGETMILKITSLDTTHGFYIEGLDIAATLKPKETLAIQITPQQPGEYRMICSLYCGSGHSVMFGLLVVSPA